MPCTWVACGESENLLGVWSYLSNSNKCLGLKCKGFYDENTLIVINGIYYVISLCAESIYNTIHHYC